jgi:hypothetical protein
MVYSHLSVLPPPQLIVHTLGGEVKTAEGGGEYGRMPMRVERESTLFATETQDSQLVWMSHGDEAVRLPDGFSVVARSEQGAIVAVENPQRRIFGLQYHPEVVHRCGGAVRCVSRQRRQWTCRQAQQDVLAARGLCSTIGWLPALLAGRCGACLSALGPCPQRWAVAVWRGRPQRSPARPEDA